MWTYNAAGSIPKYVHFCQVTQGYMQKWVVSQCNRQTTDGKHAETQESKAPWRCYAIRDHAACTEIEGLVTWRQEAKVWADKRCPANASAFCCLQTVIVSEQAQHLASVEGQDIA